MKAFTDQKLEGEEAEGRGRCQSSSQISDPNTFRFPGIKSLLQQLSNIYKDWIFAPKTRGTNKLLQKEQFENQTYALKVFSLDISGSNTCSKDLLIFAGPMSTMDCHDQGLQLCQRFKEN